ncbi:class II glutamine amidotransferase [Methanosphaera sp.]
MCELFGVSCSHCVQINDYLESFYKHCENHPHGWGLALMQDNQSIIDKQPMKALDSEYLRQLLDCPIFAEHAFAHIRLATMGYMDSFNCHPFLNIDKTGRTWTLIHNGTIFKSDLLNKYIPSQIGETDSERVLMHIIDKINEIESKREEPLDDNEMFHLLETIISTLAEGNKLNLMIYNGSTMYIHTNCDGGIHYLKKDDTIYFSTTKLSDENWKKVPINIVYAVRNGKLIYKGKKHEHEYVLSEDHFNFLLDLMSPEMKAGLIEQFGELSAEKIIHPSN